MRAFAKGEIQPVAQKFVPSLNAPFGANWNDFPTTEEVQYWGLGLISKVVGLSAAAHIGVLLAHLLAALSFFVTCRLLRYDRAPSLFGALLFSFSSYIYIRGFAHLVLTLCWHLPLAILVTWWCGSRRNLMSSPVRLWTSVASAVITGIQSPYYLNIFLQFLALATLSHLLQKRWRHVVSIFLVGLAAVLGFLLMNVDTLSYTWQHGQNDRIVVRPFAAYEQLSLLPTRMLLPQRHRWQAWEQFARERYNSQLTFHTKERGGNYLGAIGIVGLLWLFLSSLRHVLVGQPQRVPIHAWQSLWVLLYSMCGGLNWMLAVFLDIRLFRGGNRYSIVILVLVLLFLVRELSRKSRWHWYLVPLAVVVTGFGLWDSLTPRSHLAQRVIESGLQKVDSDREFISAAEELLPHGAMVFNFPVCGFPEAGIYGRLCYDPLRPYLHAEDLRFSYGTHKGRPRDNWQRDLDYLPLPMAIRVLERLGFAGLLVHTDYLEDDGKDLLKRLSAIDRRPILSSEKSELVLVRLEPRADAVPLVVSLGDGWHRTLPKEELVWRNTRVRWSYRRSPSELIVLNGTDKPTQAVLRFGLVSRQRLQRVQIRLEGRVIRELALEPGSTTEIRALRLQAQPGETRLWLSTKLGEVDGSKPSGRGRGIDFGIVRLEVLPLELAPPSRGAGTRQVR